jgi:hypothetical protein
MRAAIIALLLAGCAPVHYPQVGQPRMLQWGVSMPRCLWVCIATATVTDAEKGAATSTVTTNATSTISDNDTKTSVSPPAKEEPK